MERVDIMSWTFKFSCATTGVPKKGKSIVWHANRGPENLAEMLVWLRGMGYRPEDIAVYETRVETELGYTRFG